LVPELNAFPSNPSLLGIINTVRISACEVAVLRAIAFVFRGLAQPIAAFRANKAVVNGGSAFVVCYIHGGIGQAHQSFTAAQVVSWPGFQTVSASDTNSQ